MTRTRYGTSPWLDDFPKNRRPDFPRFRGSTSVPVVIVGGGLTGCLTAYAFVTAGVKVTLIEADRVGQGGACRGPGVLQGEAAASYTEVEARHGRKAARALFETSRRAVLDLAAAARRIGIKNVETHDALRVRFFYGADERAFTRELAIRRDVGLNALGLNVAAAGRESGMEGIGGAIKLRDWGSVNPYQLLVAVAVAAAKRGAAMHERSPARRIKVRRQNTEIELDDGTLTADTVIICTGEPTELHRPLKRHLHLAERYVVMTDRLPAAVRRQIASAARVITTTESPPHVLRWTEDGRIVIAGADQPRPGARGKDKVLVQRTGQLMYELSRMYPAISGVMPVNGWEMPLATTADGVMYAGAHRNYPHHLFAWGTRHDAAQAFLASRILLRSYLGAPLREDSFYAFTRG